MGYMSYKKNTYAVSIVWRKSNQFIITNALRSASTSDDAFAQFYAELKPDYEGYECFLRIETGTYTAAVGRNGRLFIEGDDNA